MKFAMLTSLIAALSLSLPETELLGVKVKNGNSKNGEKGKGKTPEPNKGHFYFLAGKILLRQIFPGLQSN